MGEGGRKPFGLDPLGLQFGGVVLFGHWRVHRLARRDRAGQDTVIRALHRQAFGKPFQRVFRGAIGGFIDEALDARLRGDENQRAAAGFHVRPKRLRQLKRGLDADIHGGAEGGEADRLQRFRAQDGGIVDQRVDRAGDGADGAGCGLGIGQIDGDRGGRPPDLVVDGLQPDAVHIHQDEVRPPPSEDARDGGTKPLPRAGDDDALVG